MSRKEMIDKIKAAILDKSTPEEELDELLDDIFILIPIRNIAVIHNQLVGDNFTKM